jgi:MinD-like ATPase involved in chromosome partitioning or flagellar assembly
MTHEQDFYARYLNPPAATGEAEDPESGEQPFADRWADGGDRTRSAAHAAPDRDPNGHRAPEVPDAPPLSAPRPQFPPQHQTGPTPTPTDRPQSPPPMGPPAQGRYPADPPYPPGQDRQGEPAGQFTPYPAPQDPAAQDSPAWPDLGAAEQRGHYPPRERHPEPPPQHYPPRQGPPAAPLAPRGDGRAADTPGPDAGRHYPSAARNVPSSSVGPMRAQVRQADLVRPYKPIPEIGWRKKLHQLTRINAGVGPAEREWIDLKRRLGVNLRGTYLIAIMQQKGGASKTTSTIGLGEALARYRDDKVVAIDANPANGNLASRVDEPSTGTWRSLIADPNLVSYSDFRHYLGKDTSCGLEVLGSDVGDDVMTGMNLIQAWDKLSRQYPIGLIDCGNQMRDDLTAAILSRVDAVVVVSTTRFDGATGAQDTLNWLISHGYPHLVRSAVMIISNVNKVSADKAVRNLHEDFERVCRAVHDIPYDPHLSDATAINFDRLAPATRRAFLEAAASVVDGFAGAADKDPGYRNDYRDYRGDGR